MVLVIVPGVEEVTHTLRVQVNPPLMLPPLQENVPVPVTALRLPPEQFADFDAAVELEIVTPAGRASVTLTLVRLVSDGAMTLMVRSVFAPGRMLAGVNDFEPVTGTAEACTVRTLLFTAPTLLIPWPVATTPPLAMLFVYVPATELVTWKTTVQLPGGIVPPESVSVFVPEL